MFYFSDFRSLFFWYVILVRNHIEPFSIYSFFRRVYSNDVIVPYWFLYSHLSILLMLPLIRKWPKNMKKKKITYFDFHVYHFFLC